MAVPTIQASNVRICNITTRTATIKWDNGDGNNRIVVITPERIESNSTTSSTNSNSPIVSTYNLPNILEQRAGHPGYNVGDYAGINSEYGSGKCGCKSIVEDNSCGCKSKCNINDVFLPPYQSLPINDIVYNADMKFGLGSEIFRTFDPVIVPNPNESINSFVVYNGNGSEVTVLGLESERTYYVSIYEYNLTEDMVNMTQQLEYLLTENRVSFTTHCRTESGSFDITITDGKTCHPIMGEIQIYDKCNKLVDKGFTDICGNYRTIPIGLGGYNIKAITTRGEATISNAYLKAKAKVDNSPLQVNSLTGPRKVNCWHIDDINQVSRTYNIRL